MSGPWSSADPVVAFIFDFAQPLITVRWLGLQARKLGLNEARHLHNHTIRQRLDAAGVEFIDETAAAPGYGCESRARKPRSAKALLGNLQRRRAAARTSCETNPILRPEERQQPREIVRRAANGDWFEPFEDQLQHGDR